MNNPTWRLWFVVAILGSAAFVVTYANAAGAGVPRWKQLLGWLPEDTETLVVANGPFAVSEFKEDKASEFHNFVTLLPIGPLLRLQDGLFGRALAEQKITCIVEGSRAFTAPNRFGLMPYEGVHIVQFEDASADQVRKAFQGCLAKASKTLELAGQHVAVFNAKLEDNEWSYFVAQPKSGLLICGTNRHVIDETLNRMTRAAAKRALPDDLPEWRHVDVDSHVWAIRHYRKKSPDDPSSPYRQQPMVPSDSAAVGIVFWWKTTADKVARVHYLSDATDSLRIATEGWRQPSEDLLPRIKKSDLGSIEIVATITQERATRAFMHVLLAYLGHGISV